MNEHQQPQNDAWKIPTLFGVTIALLGANIYSFLQIDQLKTDLAKTQESIQGELSTVRETNSLSAQTSQKNIQSLQAQLAAARAAAAAGIGSAKQEAEAHAEELSAKLASEQKRMEEQTNKAITQVSQDNAATAAKVGAVSNEVGSVKTEVSSVKQDLGATRADLDKTISGLKSAQGDLGIQSGLIATNSTELKALKELGDRNYFEFKLNKTKLPSKIADISVLLKNVDPKRNRYTIEVTADDKKFERKDKAVREPVQFMVSSYRQPYELVVNEITKDQISGYLAQPKVKAARN